MVYSVAWLDGVDLLSPSKEGFIVAKSGTFEYHYPLYSNDPSIKRPENVLVYYNFIHQDIKS